MTFDKNNIWHEKYLNINNNLDYETEIGTKHYLIRKMQLITKMIINHVRHLKRDIDMNIIN